MMNEQQQQQQQPIVNDNHHVEDRVTAKADAVVVVVDDDDVHQYVPQQRQQQNNIIGLAAAAPCRNLIQPASFTRQQQQFLIRFEMIHRTFVVIPPQQQLIYHPNQQQQQQLLLLLLDVPPSLSTIECVVKKNKHEQDLIHYIKRNIIAQIQQLKLKSYDDMILRTLQRHLHSHNDLVITNLNFPFGNVSLRCHLYQLYGGKGGFGTLLKGQSKQSSMNTTKNFTSCRNLQGQRLQQVNDQIHLKLVMEWREKIQNGIATEYDMIQALTNTTSGIPGWHLPLPSWSEVSMKKEMKQNQKLLHQYKREQQQKQKMSNDMKQQQEQQLHYYINTTNQWTERMERTVTSALQQSIQKQRKQQQRLMHQQQQVDINDVTTSHNQKRQKVENDPKLMTTTIDNKDQNGIINNQIDILYRQEQLSLIPPIVTISGNATIALLPSSLLSLSSSTSNTNEHQNQNHQTTTGKESSNSSTHEILYWNIQSNSNFCTIGVLLDYDTIQSQLSTMCCLYYEVVIVTGTGELQIGWAATTMTSTTPTTNTDEHNNKNEPQLFQPNSDNGDGVGDCPYSWGYDPTRNIKLHNSIAESYSSHDEKSDNTVPSTPIQLGDVIGCTYNVSKGEIYYSYNGNELGIAYTTSSNKGQHMIPAISLNEGEQIELRLYKHEMKYLPITATSTAVGETLLMKKSSSYEPFNNDNTGIVNSRKDDEGNNNNGDDDDNDRKPPAIETTDVIPYSGSSVQVIESKDNKGAENSILSDAPIDLHQYNSASELEVLGLQRLKAELVKVGLKCGGTLQERATRLFAIRDIVNPNDYPTKLLAPTKILKR